MNDNPRILIIEDEDEERDNLASLLSHKGFSPIKAETGSKGLEKFKFIYLIFLFFALLLNLTPMFSYSLPFEYERLMVNFKGIAFNQRSVLCYGDGGIVLRSTDRGNKWKQIKVAPYEYITTKIINIGTSYYGILDSNYVIYSKDDGLNWNLSLTKDGSVS